MFSRRSTVRYRRSGVFTVLLTGILAAGAQAAELQPTDPEAIHMFPLGGGAARDES